MKDQKGFLKLIINILKIDAVLTAVTISLIFLLLYLFA